jgi:hypothetical protein
MKKMDESKPKTGPLSSSARQIHIDTLGNNSCNMTYRKLFIDSHFFRELLPQHIDRPNSAMHGTAPRCGIGPAWLTPHVSLHYHAGMQSFLTSSLVLRWLRRGALTLAAGLCLGLAACGGTMSTSDGSSSGSGITVFGDIDANVSRTR